MEGVTILSTATIMLGISWGTAILISLVIFVFDFIILSITSVDEPIEYLYAAIIAIIMTIVGSIPIWCSVNTTEVTEYKVTIDETVNFVEFNEKYEVVNQEGEIYTIRERTE